MKYKCPYCPHQVKSRKFFSMVLIPVLQEQPLNMKTNAQMIQHHHLKSSFSFVGERGTGQQEDSTTALAPMVAEDTTLQQTRKGASQRQLHTRGRRTKTSSASTKNVLWKSKLPPAAVRRLRSFNNKGQSEEEAGNRLQVVRNQRLRERKVFPCTSEPDAMVKCETVENVLPTKVATPQALRIESRCIGSGWKSSYQLLHLRRRRSGIL